MKRSRIIFMALLVVLLTVAPFRIVTDEEGKLVIALPKAMAKSGSGSDGEGGGGNSGSGGGGDDGGGDDGGNSGSGGGDDDGSDDGDDGDDSSDDGDDGEDDDGGRTRGKGHGGKAAAANPVHAEKLPNGARVTFSDGSAIEVSNGRFSRTSANGRVVERRSARGSDVSRLRTYFAKLPPKPVTSASRVEAPAVRAYYRGRNVEIQYANGWREQIKSGRYTLTDQFGRTVASRQATRDDTIRLERFRQK